MTMENIGLIAFIVMFIGMVWLHGYFFGDLHGFRQGCALWRPSYYRVYRLYMNYHRSLAVSLLDTVKDDEKRKFITSEIERIDSVLAVLQSEAPDTDSAQEGGAR